MLLPQKLGPITLMRKLGADGVAEAFVGILDEPAGQHVVVRKLLPFVVQEPARLSAVESRVQDLTAVRHPTLVPVLRMQQVGEDRLVVEDHVDAVSLGDVIAWCRKQGTPLPHNVFLNLATQICNGLEALHGRPGKASGEENVLHLALGPDSVLLTPEGRLLVGEYGLVRSPTSLPSSGGTDAAARRLAHVSPEQTHPDQKLTPASDVFSLGSLLFELLMLEPLFRRDSSLQTIHAVRKAEVSGALQRVKKSLPGLDKVLYRALSLNPRHRYQRAFVLREDIRGLMAGYSFTRISEETSDFLAPLFAARAASRPQSPTPAPTAGGIEGDQDSTGALLREAAGISTGTPPPVDRAGAPGSGSSRADDTSAFLRGVAQDTLVPTFSGSGEYDSGALPGSTAASNDDDLDGLEMWSEVPTTVDPTDPSAVPIATSSDLPAAERQRAPGSDVPLDQTTWIPVERKVDSDGGPPSNAFEADAKTDVSPDPTPPPNVRQVGSPATTSNPGTDPNVSKRQLSTEELAALGVKVRPTPEPAQRRTGAQGEVASGAATGASSSNGTPTETPARTDSQAPTVAPESAATEKAAADTGGSEEPTPEPIQGALGASSKSTPAPAASSSGSGSSSQPSSRSSYRPPGAATPKPAPSASSKGPKLQGRKLEGLTFDEEEVTAVTDDEDEDDLDWRPRRSGRGLAIAGAALAVFVVVLLCGGVAVIAGQGVVTGWLSPGPVASNGPGLTPMEPAPVDAEDPADDGTADAATPADDPGEEPAEAQADATNAGGAVAAAEPEPETSADPAPSASMGRPPRPISDTRRNPEPSSVGRTEPVRRDPTPTRDPEPRVSSLAPTTSRTPSTRSRPTPRRDPDPPRLSTPDDGASLAESTPTSSVIQSTEPDDLDALSQRAQTGRLSAADRLTLEMVERDDPTYTRAHAILYDDAKAREDGSAKRKYLDALLSHPENTYNPMFLVEGAHMDIDDKRFDRALSRATTAERYWARMPSSVIFTRKAMIYEAQAAAWQGKFYQSGGSDLGALGRAISAWEKYQRHVSTKSRADLSQIADKQLTKLYDARRRLE